jgi:hypothetical protein
MSRADPERGDGMDGMDTFNQPLNLDLIPADSDFARCHARV